jgi:hypothetical protein
MRNKYETNKPVEAWILATTNKQNE